MPRVVVTRPDGSPMQGVTVDLISTNTMGRVGTGTTDQGGAVNIASGGGPFFVRALVSGDRHRVLVTSDANAPCYDYVVDGDGGGTHLTLQAVITELAAITTGSNGQEYSVFLCGITTENVAVPSMTKVDVINIHGNTSFSSGSPGRAGVVGVNSAAAAVIAIAAGAPTLACRDIFIGAASVGTTALVSHGSSSGSRWQNCSFHSLIAAGFDLGGGLGIALMGCNFAANVTCSGSNTPEDISILGCQFLGTNGVDMANTQDSKSVIIEGNNFTTGGVLVNRFSHLSIVDNHFSGRSTAAAEITIGGNNSQDATITGNTIDNGAGSPANPAILLRTGGQLRDIAISGNLFGFRANNQPFIQSTNSDTQFVAVVGNVFGRTGTGYLITQVIGCEGTFANSVFGPNAPGQRVQYDVTGTENEFYPPGSGGGGAGPFPPAAPSDAQFLALAVHADLSAERVLTAGLNMFATDAGANGAYTLDSWREGATVTPSAGTLTLGTDGDFFHVAAGNFATIATPTRQLLAVLVFDGVSVVTHGANLVLQDAANFTSAAGDVLIMAHDGAGVWREINRHTAASSGGGHDIHDETSAALTTRAGLYFQGRGITAVDNAGSTRTEVIVGTTYDAIVDSGDTNAAGKGNVYATLQAAITAGHVSIFFRESTDGSDITIASGDSVARIVGDSSVSATIPVNITCNKTGVLFDTLQFSGKTLRLAATQCRAFACIFTGTVTSPSALLNGALTSATTSIPFDGGTNGGLTSGYTRVDHEYISHTLATGHATAGTLSATAGRGLYYTRQIPHSDNQTIVDLGKGHLEIVAADCEITACFWLACSNTDAQCIYITADRARITACSFISNSTFMGIALGSPNPGVTGAPNGVEVIGTKFSGNSFYQAAVQYMMSPNAANGGFCYNLKVNGCSFRETYGGGVRGVFTRANIAGNTFSSAAQHTLTAVVNFNGLTGMASTDSAVSFDGSAGTGTLPAMGYVKLASGEIASYARAKTGTATGTATGANTATTLSDSGAAWTTDEWIGQIVHSDGDWGIITANSATQLTVDSWRTATPTNGQTYTILPSLVGMQRGLFNTTAAAVVDNDSYSYLSDIAVEMIYGGNIAATAQSNIVSGNTFSAVRMPFVVQSDRYDTGAVMTQNSPTLLTGNIFVICGEMIGGLATAYVGNMIGGMNIDLRSATAQSFLTNAVPSGQTLIFSNVPADTFFFSNVGFTGIPTSFRIPASKNVQLGGSPGDATPLVIPMRNEIAAAGTTTAGNIAAIRNATSDSSFIDNPGAGSTLVCGVQMETGIANGSQCMIAVAGVVSVMCTTAAVVRGDLLQSSATAGQAAPAAAAAGAIIGKALEAKAAGATGLVKCLLVLA